MNISYGEFKEIINAQLKIAGYSERLPDNENGLLIFCNYLSAKYPEDNFILNLCFQIQTRISNNN